MPPFDSMFYLYLLGFGATGLGLGVLIGLGISRSRTEALRHERGVNLEKIKICNEGGIDEARLKLFPKRGKNL